MSINSRTLLFFDASCLIAGAGSPTGGSGFLLSLCTRRLLRGAVSQSVLLEVERNMLSKMSVAMLERCTVLLQSVPLTIVPAVPAAQREDETWAKYVNAKDRHVVAAALAADCPYLLTLDQPLLAEVNQAGMHIRAITPGAFITKVLPNHSEFAQLR